MIRFCASNQPQPSFSEPPPLTLHPNNRRFANVYSFPPKPWQNRWQLTQLIHTTFHEKRQQQLAEAYPKVVRALGDAESALAANRKQLSAVSELKSFCRLDDKMQTGL
jgi:hypothetical protein